MAKAPIAENSVPAKRHTKLEWDTATEIKSAGSSGRAVATAATGLGSAALAGAVVVAAYLVDRASHGSPIAALGVALGGLLIGGLLSFLWWWIIAGRSDRPAVDLGGELHVIAAEVTAAACRLRNKAPETTGLAADIGRIEELTGRLGMLARYADVQAGANAGSALAAYRDARLTQDAAIHDFQEHYAKLLDAKAPPEHLQRAIADLRDQLRPDSGGPALPAPPLAAILAPVEGGCRRI